MIKSTQSERLAVIETEVNYIKEDVSEIKKDLKSFIDSADTKYASKVKVDVLERKVDSQGLTLAKYGGGIAIAIIAIEVILKFLL